MTDITLVQSLQAWNEACATAKPTIDLSRSFPRNPFKREGGVYFCHADETFGSEISQVMDGLMRRAGDAHMTAVQLAPRRDTSWRRKHMWPAFQIGRDEIGSEYVDYVWHEPAPAASIANLANVFVAWGERGSWALWSEPRWEILALWIEGDLLERDASWSQIYWMSLQEVVDELFVPEKQHDKPSARQRETFRAEFGSTRES